MMIKGTGTLNSSCNLSGSEFLTSRKSECRDIENHPQISTWENRMCAVHGIDDMRDRFPASVIGWGIKIDSEFVAGVIGNQVNRE
jgi:hypothetical protein